VELRAGRLALVKEFVVVDQARIEDLSKKGQTSGFITKYALKGT